MSAFMTKPEQAKLTAVDKLIFFPIWVAIIYAVWKVFFWINDWANDGLWDYFFMPILFLLTMA